jgi:hypothetical protein
MSQIVREVSVGEGERSVKVQLFADENGVVADLSFVARVLAAALSVARGA